MRKDIVAYAETGSGKTIAYLFPLIGNILVKGNPKNLFLNIKIIMITIKK